MPTLPPSLPPSLLQLLQQRKHHRRPQLLKVRHSLQTKHPSFPPSLPPSLPPCLSTSTPPAKETSPEAPTPQSPAFPSDQTSLLPSLPPSLPASLLQLLQQGKHNRRPQPLKVRQSLRTKHSLQLPLAYRPLTQPLVNLMYLGVNLRGLQ